MNIEEEDSVDKAGGLSKAQPEDGDKANDGTQEDDEADDDEVQVPETMPEDAFFIPLGLVRQCPPTHYKGNDPEWQSFVEFNDLERRAAVRSELTSLHSRDQYLTLYQKSWQTWSIPSFPARKSFRENLGYP